MVFYVKNSYFFELKQKWKENENVIDSHVDNLQNLVKIVKHILYFPQQCTTKNIYLLNGLPIRFIKKEYNSSSPPPQNEKQYGNIEFT